MKIPGRHTSLKADNAFRSRLVVEQNAVAASLNAIPGLSKASFFENAQGALQRHRNPSRPV